MNCLPTLAFPTFDWERQILASGAYDTRFLHPKNEPLQLAPPKIATLFFFIDNLFTTALRFPLTPPHHTVILEKEYLRYRSFVWFLPAEVLELSKSYEPNGVGECWGWIFIGLIELAERLISVCERLAMRNQHPGGLRNWMKTLLPRWRQEKGKSNTGVNSVRAGDTIAEGSVRDFFWNYTLAMTVASKLLDFGRPSNAIANWDLEGWRGIVDVVDYKIGMCELESGLLVRARDVPSLRRSLGRNGVGKKVQSLVESLVDFSLEGKAWDWEGGDCLL
ncbi:hypothetical protein BJ508DRAFT_157200 [Ascobolus immersus RN42]|uniref:Uncharacterized protein n=1 Tax=Ascobolus immersus RN42 TaxID=1160509 RepID=A0A3N4I928_ASCIM|nr:hypothetical protein BJ508DRAFT_157200 [Ascobolus immersus RN42]